MWWLDPLDYYWTDIPYASAVTLELHYNQTCISDQSTRNESCFTVEATHDGRPLKFDTCIDSNVARGSESQICMYPDFKRYIDKIRPKGDVFQLCDQEYKP